MANFIGTAFDDRIDRFGVSPGVLADSLLALPGIGADVIDGGDGDDFLDGAGGADLLLGGDGRDTLWGGYRSDTLLGGAGDDRLLGGDGIMNFFGRFTDDGDDSVDGGEGDDTIEGGGGDNTLSGGYGNDSLFSLGGVLMGGPGDDTLHGFSFGVLTGDEGDDLIYGGPSGSFDGGAGVDTLIFFDTTGTIDFDDQLSLDLESGILIIEGRLSEHPRRFFNFENVYGDYLLDTIRGTDGANILSGGFGDDQFWGRGGDDTLYGGGGDNLLSGDGGDDLLTITGTTGGRNRLLGGAGDDVLSVDPTVQSVDTLDGGRGADVMDGGGADDLYIVDDAGDVAAEGDNGPRGGDDTVRASVSHTLGGGIERLTLTGGEAIDGTGNWLANTLRGNGEDNRLDGLRGDDTVFGGAGRDVLRGDAGDDSLLGGEGDDTLAGGSGDDVLLGGEGQDTASYAGAAGSVAVRLGVSGPQDSGGAGVDALVSVEHLEGSDFADTLGGTVGANRLEGGDGADLLSGGGGSDTLVGGLGADRLAGGFGPSDVFVIRSLAESAFAAPDVLAAEGAAAAFAGAGAAAGDLIDVSAIDADAAQDGAQDFVFGTAPGVGRLWAVDDAATTDTLILGDADGAGDLDFAIRIEDGAVLASAYTAADFVV